MSERSTEFGESLATGLLFGIGIFTGFAIIILAIAGIVSMFDVDPNPKPKCPDFAYARKVGEHWRCVQTIPPIGELAE